MKTIDELFQEWETDSKISSALGDESLNTPKLHAKYLRYLCDVKLILRKRESELLSLKTTKAKYFRGEMSREELEEKQWKQYQGLKPLKSDMDSVLDSDSDVIKANERVDYYKTFVSALEFIMKELNSRRWAIRTALDYYKIQNGIV